MKKSLFPQIITERPMIKQMMGLAKSKKMDFKEYREKLTAQNKAIKLYLKIGRERYLKLKS